MVSRLAALCFFVFAAVGSSAAAQESESTGEATTSADFEARASFRAGRTAYEEGRYEDALRSFRHAYSLSERSELLFNVGQCLDRLRRDEEALTTFEAYLETTPDAENRPAVEARIEVLREVVRESQERDAAVAADGSDGADEGDTDGGGNFGSDSDWSLGLPGDDQAGVVMGNATSDVAHEIGSLYIASGARLSGPLGGLPLSTNTVLVSGGRVTGPLGLFAGDVRGRFDELKVELAEVVGPTTADTIGRLGDPPTLTISARLTARTLVDVTSLTMEEEDAFLIVRSRFEAPLTFANLTAGEIQIQGSATVDNPGVPSLSHVIRVASAGTQDVQISQAGTLFLQGPGQLNITGQTSAEHIEIFRPVDVTGSGMHTLFAIDAILHSGFSTSTAARIDLQSCTDATSGDLCTGLGPT